MEQDSTEDIVLNGDVQTPIRDTDIGRSGAKMLGMLSETDNSGMDYQSFTEESAVDEEVNDYGSREYKDADEETKAFYSNEIILPRISSAENGINVNNNASNSLLLPLAENTGSKKKKKSSTSNTKRGRSRTSSKEKKRRRGSANSKDRKRTGSKSKKKPKRKKKKKKRKKKRRNSSKARLTGAEVRLRMDPYALACATKWEELGNEPPIDREVEEYSISYPPGPMGITFDWRNGLVVMALLKSNSNETKNKNDNISNTNVIKKQPMLGSRLVSINNVSVVSLSFKENVDMLRNLADKNRTLTFQFSK